MGLDGGMENASKEKAAGRPIDILKAKGEEFGLSGPRLKEYLEHQRRFVEMADLSRGTIDRLFRNREVTLDEVIDQARVEAERELEDRNRKNDYAFDSAETKKVYEKYRAEYAKWKEMFEPVRKAAEENAKVAEENRTIQRENDFIAVENMLRAAKGESLKEKIPLKEKPHKLGLYIMGGGVAGVDGGACVMALNQMGIRADAFEILAGTSAGAADVMYYLSGVKDPLETQKGVSIYPEQCTKKDFINPARFWEIMNINWLAGLMGKGKYEVNTKPIMESKVGLYFGVVPPTEPGETPRAEFVDAKTAVAALESEHSGMLSLMRNSMTVPFLRLGKLPPAVNGREYLDGAFDPLPIQKLIEQFKLTDVLVIPNAPFDLVDSFQTANGSHWFARLVHNFGFDGTRGMLGQLQKFLLIKEQTRKSLEFIKEAKGVNIGIAWGARTGAEALTHGEMGKKILEGAVYDCARNMFDVMGREQPAAIEYNPVKA